MDNQNIPVYTCPGRDGKDGDPGASCQITQQTKDDQGNTVVTINCGGQTTFLTISKGEKGEQGQPGEKGDPASYTDEMAKTAARAVCLEKDKPGILEVAGDASFTIHSNTDTQTSGGNKMLVLKTGKTSPKDVFTVDNKGTNGVMRLYSAETETVRLHGSKSEPSYIMSSLGIGTTTPNENLSISGTVSFYKNTTGGGLRHAGGVYFFGTTFNTGSYAELLRHNFMPMIGDPIVIQVDLIASKANNYEGHGLKQTAGIMTLDFYDLASTATLSIGAMTVTFRWRIISATTYVLEGKITTCPPNASHASLIGLAVVKGGS
jgi:hypothetical protein